MTPATHSPNANQIVRAMARAFGVRSHIAISGMLCLTGDEVVRLEFSAIRFDPSQLMVALRAMRTFGGPP